MVVTLAALILVIFLPISAKRVAAGDLRFSPLFFVLMFLLVSILSSYEIIYSEFARLWSQEGAIIFSNYNIIYFSFISIAIILASPEIFKSNFKIAKIDIKLGNFGNNVYFLISAIFIFAISILHIFAIDLNGIHFSSQYLFINSINILEHQNSFTAFIHTGRVIFGVIAFSLLGIAIASNNKLALFILALPCMWYFTITFAGHSRFTVAFAGATAGILFVSGKRRLAGIFGVLALIAYSSALAGRNSGTHGLSVIWSSALTGLSPSFEQIQRIITNFFEGVYNQGEVFLHIHREHPDIYKMLSFSPLPSFIDGYSSNALPSQLRYHTFVPIGATSEVLMFGWQYALIYWSFVAIIYRIVIKSFSSSNIYIPIVALVIFLFAFYAQFTYPTRWVVRPYILAALIALTPNIIALLRRTLRRS